MVCRHDKDIKIVRLISCSWFFFQIRLFVGTYLHTGKHCMALKINRFFAASQSSSANHCIRSWWFYCRIWQLHGFGPRFSWIHLHIWPINDQRESPSPLPKQGQECHSLAQIIILGCHIDHPEIASSNMP